ncbi:hypothetical protein BHE74_00020582 [Ensete ventricosum]|nr:hypothetical protein BHE74_00020582 [Ensete ventricosum]
MSYRIPLLCLFLSLSSTAKCGRIQLRPPKSRGDLSTLSPHSSIPQSPAALLRRLFMPRSPHKIVFCFCWFSCFGIVVMESKEDVRKTDISLPCLYKSVALLFVLFFALYPRIREIRFDYGSEVVSGLKLRSSGICFGTLRCSYGGTIAASELHRLVSEELQELHVGLASDL